jgi:uncharacterized membrane protein
MMTLVLGLLIFLGVHSSRIFAGNWREQQIQKMGEGPWKGIVAGLSLLGLVLIVIGYGAARMDPVWLWASPMWTRHLAALLTVPAFVLVVAAYMPGSNIRAKVGHPMLLGVKIWAFAHLMANGTLADLILFGSFLVWAIVNFAVSRRRDRLAGIKRTGGRAIADVQAVVLGIISWALFAMFLHRALIGVSPFAIGV